MELAEIVARAQRRGFVGKAPVGQAIEHARGFAVGLETAPLRVLDLGSGGGLPGLALAVEWPKATVALLESNQRRCAFLRDAATRLGVDERVFVVEARAEVAGRLPELRGCHDVVTARGFGRPGVTAECGAPFLRVGGWLVVSEPPSQIESTVGSRERWPRAGLQQLGLTSGQAWTTEFHYQSLAQVEPCPLRFPRRTGVPAKRPLF